MRNPTHRVRSFAVAGVFGTLVAVALSAQASLPSYDCSVFKPYLNNLIAHNGSNVAVGGYMTFEHFSSAQSNVWSGVISDTPTSSPTAQLEVKLYGLDLSSSNATGGAVGNVFRMSGTSTVYGVACSYVKSGTSWTTEAEAKGSLTPDKPNGASFPLNLPKTSSSAERFYLLAVSGSPGGGGSSTNVKATLAHLQ